ncbi:MAG: hypothetical protein WBV94_03405 [Blastocatellia bacterium]
MARGSLPRYFVSRADDQSPTAPLSEELPPAHIMDSFFIGNRHLQEREWVTAIDCLGTMQALPDERWTSFPASVQSELAYHEISSKGHGRLLEVTDVFLFNLQLLEQPGGAAGWNDPVYLYGTLYGPFPEAERPRTVGIEGQLTVTRGDLLDGLVQGTDQAFRYAKPSDESGQASRCFHLMLPGGPDEDIRRGSGIILAYPLLPIELIANDISNEFVVSQLLYDLLSAMKEDLAREHIEHPLRSMVLPVPSRFILEQQLQSEGYAIKGDRAIKKAGSGEGFQGFLASVFGALMDESLEIPAEGEVDEFLDVAKLALNALPGWPSPRTVALRNCVRPASSAAARNTLSPPPVRPPQVRPPQPSAPSPPVAQPRVQARPLKQDREPPAWMQDFIAAHHQPDLPPPRLTSTSGLNWQAAPPKGAKSPQQESEWMMDFAQTSTARRTGDSKGSQPSVKPEWMEDFE